MKQLTVYDAIRTHARDVQRWQVREAVELTLKRLAMRTSRTWEARQRAKRKRADERRRKHAAELERLRFYVRVAVLEVRDSAFNRLRVIEGGKQ